MSDALLALQVKHCEPGSFSANLPPTQLSKAVTTTVNLKSGKLENRLSLKLEIPSGNLLPWHWLTLDRYHFCLYPTSVAQADRSERFREPLYSPDLLLYARLDVFTGQKRYVYGAFYQLP